MMNLEALFQSLVCIEKKNWNGQVCPAKITKDSRQIQRGDLFVACRGPQSDGHDYISEVVAKGVVAVVYERASVSLPPEIVGIQVQDCQQIFPELLKRIYDFRADSLSLIGVTGTNGKTTITQLFYKLLAAHFKAGTIGTLSYELPSGSRESGNTTPGPETLIPLLSEMAQEGARYVSMEVSSHALDQKRVMGLEFELAVFTQLTQDHLDYHKNLEDYFQAKRRLFSEYHPKHMLINRDCPFGRRLLAEFPRAKSFSTEAQADYQAVNIHESLNGCDFELAFRGKKVPVRIQLPLHYNISNCIAVLAGLDLLGLDISDYLPALEKVPFIPGRMERVPHPSIHFFVDYAHTPDAFVQVLKHVRLQKPKKIITVYGCGGDRDRTKRPKMTRAAADDSDVLIMTSDNPRTENAQVILDEMKTGLTGNDRNRLKIVEELDRRKAIFEAVNIAQAGDAVLILGKGHEDYQIIGKEKHHFSDRETVLEALGQ